MADTIHLIPFFKFRPNVRTSATNASQQWHSFLYLHYEVCVISGVKQQELSLINMIIFELFKLPYFFHVHCRDGKEKTIIRLVV